jgi:hypothetical protein
MHLPDLPYAPAGRRSALSLALFLLSAVPGARAQAGDCSDAFDGSDLGPMWTFVDADGSAGGEARLENGKLVLTGRGRDVFNAVNEFVAVRRADLAGDFDVSVKIESQTDTHDWAQAGIAAAADLSALSQGGYVAADATPANGFHLFWDAAGSVGTLDAHADVGKSAYPVWLRLARAGTKFSAWYKTAAGAAWTPISQNASTQGTAGPSQIALFSLSHDASQDGQAVFDDFTCQGAVTSLAGPERGARAEGKGYLPGYGNGGAPRAWRFEWQGPRRADGRAALPAR